MSFETHRLHDEIWNRKPALRYVYNEWYKWIIKHLSPVTGITLEVGGGIGNFKQSCPRAFSSDLLYNPQLNITLDATLLPFQNSSVANLVIVDVLHHLEDPCAFINEAARCLRARGRLILLEPYLTPISRIAWRMHPEAIDFHQELFAPSRSQKPSKKPYEANQAIPYILFKTKLDVFLRTFPSFKMIYRVPFSFFAYPLSGGYEKPQLAPFCLFPAITRLERLFAFMGELAAFRIFVVLERTD